MKDYGNSEKLVADKVLKETADIYPTGTLKERYAVYVASAHDTPPKSFQQWLED